MSNGYYFVDNNRDVRRNWGVFYCVKRYRFVYYKKKQKSNMEK